MEPINWPRKRGGVILKIRRRFVLLPAVILATILGSGVAVATSDVGNTEPSRTATDNSDLKINGSVFHPPEDWEPPKVRRLDAANSEKTEINGKTLDFEDFNNWSKSDKLAHLQSLEVKDIDPMISSPRMSDSSSKPRNSSTKNLNSPLDITVPPIEASRTAHSQRESKEEFTTQVVEWDAVYLSPTVGKLFVEHTDGSLIRCSASTVSANNHGTVMTAAHCLDAGTISRIFYIPAAEKLMPDLRAPYGIWQAWSYTDTACYDFDLGRCDYGFVLIPRLDNGLGIQDYVGANGISFGYESINGRTDVIGYPFHPRPRFDGQWQWRCGAHTTTVPEGHARFHYSDQCRMAQGASGGPWLVDYSSSSRNGIIMGISSWVKCDGSPCTEMYSGAYSNRLLSNAAGDYAFAQSYGPPV